jgi:hypothetical protein
MKRWMDCWDFVFFVFKSVRTSVCVVEGSQFFDIATHLGSVVKKKKKHDHYCKETKTTNIERMVGCTRVRESAFVAGLRLHGGDAIMNRVGNVGHVLGVDACVFVCVRAKRLEWGQQDEISVRA